MTTGPELTQEQIKELADRLEARRSELLALIREELLRSDQEHYRDLAGQVHDSAEESVADLLSDLDLAVIDHHLAELREVEAALQRMRSGTYGICVDCEKPIGHARLASYPWARRCATCQQVWERTRPEGYPPSL